jgi:Tfp pilus assembly protein PilF
MALMLYQRALGGREKTFGSDHISTVNTMHGMAGVFLRKGEHGKALEYYQRALHGYQNFLETWVSTA